VRCSPERERSGRRSGLTTRSRSGCVGRSAYLDSVGLHDGHNGSFTLLDFPYASDPRVLYIEHAEGSTHIEDPARVKSATLTFKHLSKLALTPGQSAELIERLAAER